MLRATQREAEHAVADFCRQAGPMGGVGVVNRTPSGGGTPVSTSGPPYVYNANLWNNNQQAMLSNNCYS